MWDRLHSVPRHGNELLPQLCSMSRIILSTAVDVVTLIFVLSGISPAKMQAVVKNFVRYLKPGGLVMFRDYGRFNLTQLRFKQGKCIQKNFYVRGDGTRCDFFTQEEIRNMFVSEGLQDEQILVDRKLQVNSGKKLKMYRLWI